ncbi:MAG: glutamine--fructose-6-phosphate transaminase (isomerizing) [Thermodesulfobacteriota bacterium]|nr:glutamine--fructose-6-phosphate transaminase (isomerizing) [Thermodesulfobacteriota bacterium]
MCGIIGYIGEKEGLPILLEGLKRLEYRGYDSAGIATINHHGRIDVVRCRGKLKSLEERLVSTPLTGTVGIGHTRWATHGKPSDENAHPHRSGPFVVVHNGIVENFAVLRDRLTDEGFRFDSETDTEVIVKLLESERRKGKSYREAVLDTLRQLRGSYAVVFLNEEEPETLVAARKESPLVLGLGEDGTYVASDVPAILSHTRRVVFLDDEDVVFIDRSGFRVEDLHGRVKEVHAKTIDWNPVMAEKAGYKHFMLKEIYEQPRAIVDTFRSVLDLSAFDVFFPEAHLDRELLSKIDRVFLVACGTSFHAALVGKYMLERLCRVPVEVDLASEFRYRDPILDERCLLLVISQSGETADTRAALVEGLQKGAHCRAIVNVLGSSLARMAQGVIYTHAGPEIGVASTKAFTTQLVALFLLSIYWATKTGRISSESRRKALQDLLELPRKMDELLNDGGVIQHWAKRYVHVADFLYLARGILFPIALEGALKLKEISYIHAEGYAAGEMKHGPIALIDENMPVVVLLRKGELYEKMISNVQEVLARDGQILALVEGAKAPKIGPLDLQLEIPETCEWLAPVLFVVPLQLLAYHIAVMRGTDVDQPRNLAKSVTVE